MKSNLEISRFRERLTENVVVGNPQFIGTPFSALLMLIQENRLFYGEHTDSTFEFTWRKLFRPVSFVIKGTFKAQDSITVLIYEFKAISLIYWVQRIIPFGFFFLINIMFFIESEPVASFVILNAVSVVMYCLILSYDYLERKNLEKEFCRIFEIQKDSAS